MNIWHGNILLEQIRELNQNTLGAHLGIEFTFMGENFIEARMPVNSNTKQPFGLLHGGASVALAETLGSVASWCCVNRELFIGVGVEINANHLKSATEGWVKAVCRPIKVGGKLHVWDIRIYDGQQDLLCICRFTCMIVPRKGR